MHVTRSYWQVAGFVDQRKKMNWSNLKKKSLLVHNEINIKINGMFNECFIYVN